MSAPTRGQRVRTKRQLSKGKGSQNTQDPLAKMPLAEAERIFVMKWQENRDVQEDTRPRLAAIRKNGEILIACPRDIDVNLSRARLAHTFGGATHPVQTALITHLINVFVKEGDTDDSLTLSIEEAVGQVHAIAPQDPLEAMLAVQLVSTQRVATQLLSAASKEQAIETATLQSDAAAHLMRLFLTQVESLQRYRGRQPLERKPSVIDDGGQAMVGRVAAVARCTADGHDMQGE